MKYIWPDAYPPKVAHMVHLKMARKWIFGDLELGSNHHFLVDHSKKNLGEVYQVKGYQGEIFGMTVFWVAKVPTRRSTMKYSPKMDASSMKYDQICSLFCHFIFEP